MRFIGVRIIVPILRVCVRSLLIASMTHIQLKTGGRAHHIRLNSRCHRFFIQMFVFFIRELQILLSMLDLLRDEIMFAALRMKGDLLWLACFIMGCRRIGSVHWMKSRYLDVESVFSKHLRKSTINFQDI